MQRSPHRKPPNWTYGRGYLWAPGRAKPDAVETSARVDFCGSCVRRPALWFCTCAHSPSPPVLAG
eukprot:8446497-Alexandrium_andersonii.AAC.1